MSARSTDPRNAREQLLAAAEWLGWQNEDLSMGLKSAADALALWRYWQARPDLPEMADEPCDDLGVDVAAARRKALGYDPLSPARQRSALKKMLALSWP